MPTRLPRPAARALLLAAAVLAALTTGTGTAHAHVAPDVTIASPEAGAGVAGPLVVVLRAAAEGSGPAQFTLHLDGQAVDATGRLGDSAAFAGLSLAPGEQLELSIGELPAGPHSLEVRYTEDGDHTKPPVRQDFVATGGDPAASPGTDSPAAQPAPSVGLGPAYSETRSGDPAAGSGPTGDSATAPAVIGGLLLALAALAAVVLAARRRSGARQR